MDNTASLMGNQSPITRTFGDKTLQVRMVDGQFKVDFEYAHANKYYKLLQGRKALMTPEEYEKALAQHDEETVGGKFAWESQLGQKFFASMAGKKLFIQLMLGVDEMELVRLVSQHAAEVSATVNYVLDASGLPKKKLEVPTPNQTA